MVSISPPASTADDNNSSAAFMSEMLRLASSENEKGQKTLLSQRGFIFAGFCKRKYKSAKNDPASDRIRMKHALSVNGTFTRSFGKHHRKRELRLLRTLLIILIVLLISTVPLGVLFLISFRETDKRYVIFAKYLLTLSLINSLVNPWIYFWRFVEMRLGLKKMFCLGL